MKQKTGVVIGLTVMLLGIVLIAAPLLLRRAPGPISQPDGTHPGTVVDLAVADRATKEALKAGNNAAVSLLKEGKCDEAIDKLRALLETCPSYGIARKNLAIAYNNKGFKQMANPKVALDSYWRASCLASDNVVAVGNINSTLKRLGKDPERFEDRVAMGDAENAQDCLYGAFAEYAAALSIHPDAEVTKKIEEIERKASTCDDDDSNGAFFVKRSLPSPVAAINHSVDQSGKDIDFGLYMAHLQRSIKRNWHPSKSKSSKKIAVFFSVSRDGTISNLKILKSSGDAVEDQAGLDAVKTFGKADPLPAGAPPSVDIQFSFDYNVFEK